jgi:thymidylate kinase
LGPDGAGKSSVICGLISKLTHAGIIVTMRHLKPQIIFPRRYAVGIIVIDPHAKPPRPALISLVKILAWLFEEWYAYLFQDKKATLLICDRYYHDILVDPLRYRYGGPAWAAKVVGKLMPQPDFWMLLDAPPEVLQSRKQEVSLAETARQGKAYRNFIRSQCNHVIIDASQPLDQVIADAKYFITKEMRKADGRQG